MKAKELVLFLGGAAIGAAVALLLAPESGEKTRRHIKRFYEDEKDRVKEAYDHARDEVKDEARRIGRRVKREVRSHIR